MLQTVDVDARIAAEDAVETVCLHACGLSFCFAAVAAEVALAADAATAAVEMTAACGLSYCSYSAVDVETTADADANLISDTLQNPGIPILHNTPYFNCQARRQLHLTAEVKQDVSF